MKGHEGTDDEVAVTARDKGGELLKAEDLRIGIDIDLGSHAVSEEEIIGFASVWDAQVFHTDRVAAGATVFGGLIASGLHTVSIFQRLSVTAVLQRYDVIAGKEIRRLRFLAPVRPGDVLTGVLQVVSTTSDHRGRALVVTTGQLTNQDGRTVMDIELESLIASRLAPRSGD